MRVSVIIPCHNAGPWIAEALQSVREQTLAAHEIIVIDDDSSDDSISQIERSGVPVKLLRAKFHNAAAARNAGIEIATGDWIALLDADDVWYPNHLHRANVLLNSNGNRDVAFMANHDWIDLEGRVIPIPEAHRCTLPAPQSGMSLKDYFSPRAQAFHFGHSTVLYCRDLVMSVGMFDVSQKRRHDIDLWLRALAGNTWTYDTVKAAGYREATPGSISKSSLECDYYYLRALTKNCQFLDSPSYRAVLAHDARRAMGIAFVDAPPEHYARIRELALPHLPRFFKLFYQLGFYCPSLLRSLIKLKRWFFPHRADNLPSPEGIIDKLIKYTVAPVKRIAEISIIGAGWLLRYRSFRKLLEYDPKLDYSIQFVGNGVETMEINIDQNKFALPPAAIDAVSGFLEAQVCASFKGKVFDPVVRLETDGFSDRQSFERGGEGVRWFNISRLLNSSVKAGQTVNVNGKRFELKSPAARLHLCRERIQKEDRILVIAPHPDDAEIAAFGLYSTTQATVVTVTAGDRSDQFGRITDERIHLPRSIVARMRVWDSLAVPRFGGCSPEQVVNLCYPDGHLDAMYNRRNTDFWRGNRNFLDFLGLRSLNQSSLVRDEKVCSWDSLIRDLVHIFEQKQPTVIVAPHPWLDPHTDHLFTTIAACEALQTIGARHGRFYFYVNHNRHSELYPFGSAGAGIGMPPVFPGDKVECSGFYSHPLTTDQQRQKFLVLEAMHDMREIGAPQPLGFRVHLRRAQSEVIAAIHGLGNPPTSYFRRAVRPDELFLTVSFDQGCQLCSRVLEENLLK